MKPEQFDEIMKRTLDDRRLSRSERKALRRLVSDADLDEQQLRLFQQRAFDIARELKVDSADQRALDCADGKLQLERPPPFLRFLQLPHAEQQHDRARDRRD